MKLKKLNLLNIVIHNLKKIQSLKNIIIRFFKYEELKNKNMIVNFIHEGNLKIKLPRSSFFQILFNYGICTKRNIDYNGRAKSEALFRKTIYELYKCGYLNSNKSIIDIGSWIADNSIVWAKFLTNKALVFAVDPSEDNHNYGRILSKINNIKNIKWVKAVCNDKANQKLFYEGSIYHTNFNDSGNKKYLISTTLDQIISDEKNTTVDFIHIDVEGFELKVLKGAKKIIFADKPVISFEQHISKEDVKKTSNFLKKFGYRIFMINEVLPDCDLDCRNFLAFHMSKGLPKLKEFNQKNGRSLGIYSSIPGKRLIEI